MLTNPTRYVLIACRYPAWGWHYGVWLNAPEIAERYRINVRALSPALLRLVQAGILYSRVGGPKPGYMLSRDPAEIPMLEVVRALEGTFRMACCRTVLPNVQCQCEADNCRVCGVFRDILDELRSRLSGVSLEDHAATEEFLPTYWGGKTLQTKKIEYLV